ncbi:MAG: beta strand repeat-containing protein, partial [Candidatus Cryosericum sp.]
IGHGSNSWLNVTGSGSTSTFTSVGDITLNRPENYLGVVTITPTAATIGANLYNNSANANLIVTSPVTNLTLTQPNASLTFLDNKVTGSLYLNTQGGTSTTDTLTVGAQTLTSTLQLYAEGNITQTGAISTAGATTLGASAGTGNIILSNTGNSLRDVKVNSGYDVTLKSAYTGGVTVTLPRTAAGLHDVTINYPGATSVGLYANGADSWTSYPAELSGNLSVTSGGTIGHVSNSWLNVTGSGSTSTFTSVGDITLNRGENYLGAVTITPTAATIGANLYNNSANANLIVTSPVTNLTLTQPNASLELPANKVTGNLYLSTQGGTSTTDTLTVGAQTLAGSIDLRSENGLTQGGAWSIGTTANFNNTSGMTLGNQLIVGGATTLTAGAGTGNIVLSNTANSLRDVTVNSGYDVTLKSAYIGGVTIGLPQTAGGLHDVTIVYPNATSLAISNGASGAAQLGGNLSVASGGTINQGNGYLNLNNPAASSVFSAGGNITLNSGNNYLGAVTVTPTLATVSVNLYNNSANANLTVTSPITNLTLTQPNASLTLPDNQVSGSLTINTSGGATGSNISVGAQSSNGNWSLTSDGSIVQTGAWISGGNIALTTSNPFTLGYNVTTNNGAITFPTAVTLVNDVTIDTGRSSGGDINFSSTINGAYSLALLAGSGSTVTVANAIGGSNALATFRASGSTLNMPAVTTAGNQTFEANTLNDTGNFTGVGMMTLAPYSSGTSIGVAGGSGTLNLDTTMLGRVQNGFTQLVIGRADGTGAITANGYIFPAHFSEITLQNSGVGSAGIALNGAFSSTGALTLNSSGNITQSAAITANTLNLANTSAITNLSTQANSITYLGTINAAGRSFSLRNSGALDQTGIVTAGTFAANLDAGTLNLGSQTNAITNLGAITAPGGLSLKNGNALTIGGAVNVGANTATIQTTAGNITLNSTITSSAADGNAIVLASGADFINTAGAAALNPGSGRWLVYSADPANNTFGNLDSSNAGLWSKTYAGYPPGSVADAGDRYLFSYQPTLSFTSSNASKTYGDTATLTGFTVSGYQGVANAFTIDNAASAYSGTPSLTSEGTVNTANAGGYDGITIAQGTLASSAGYAFGFTSTGTLTVNKAALAVTAGADSKTYDGVAYSGGNGVIYSGFVNSETPAVLDGTLGYVGTSQGATNAGNYTITPQGLTAGNYTISYNNGQLIINPRAVTLTPPPVTKAYDGTTNYTTKAADLVDLSGFLVSGDTVTAAIMHYEHKFYGQSNKLVYLDSVTINDGNSGLNYTTTLLGNTTGTITKANLTLSLTAGLTGAVSKTYDGTNAATLAADNYSLSGIVPNDTVTLNNPTFGTYDTKDVGTGKMVTVTGLTISGGTDAANYSLASDTLNGAIGIITPYPVSMTGSRTYDGTKDVAAGIFTLGTLVSGENLTIAGTGTMADKSTGAGKTVNVSGLSLGNGSVGLASNYTFSGGTQTANISKAPLTITAATNTKTYDGGLTADSKPTVAGIQSGDTVTGLAENYADRNAATSKTLNVSAYTINDGNNGNNYTVSTIADTTGVISKAPLTITAATNAKTYDGGLTADAKPTVAGIQSGDTVTGLAETYADRNAATSKTLNVSAYTINDGNSGNNYTVSTIADTTGVISKALLTVSAAGQNKVYDSVPTASVNLSDNRLGSDDLTLSYGSAAFKDKNVGTAKPVVVGAINVTGTDSGNYTFNTTAATTADITPASLTVSAAGQNKVYDSAPTASVNLSDNRLGSDVLTFSYGSASFNDKNVGTAKPVVV